MSRMEAESLNNIIKQHNPAVYSLLSKKGRAIYFPKQGIISQSSEAKGKKYNATAGVALDEYSSALTLTSLKAKPEHLLYAPTHGLKELRELWMQQIKEKNPSLRSKTSLPLVTSGLTHALSITAYLFLDPEDKVMIPNLFWGNYSLIFKEAYGAKLNTFRFFKEDKFDINCLRNKLKEERSKKKVLLLNFPNNPSGYTPTDEEAEEIVSIIKERTEKGDNILVILDDAYFGLVYKEGILKESLFGKLADLHENVLVVKLDAATKEDYAWGLRIGFITFASKGITPETCSALESKTAGVIRNSISSASNLSQNLLMETFRSESYKKEKENAYKILKARFDMVNKILEEKRYAEYFSPLPFNSGYFMCIELKKGLDAEKIRKILLERYDTGVIALGNMIRIAYSSIPLKDIKRIFDNIYEACR